MGSTGLDRFHSSCQRHCFFHKVTYGDGRRFSSGQKGLMRFVSALQRAQGLLQRLSHAQSKVGTAKGVFLQISSTWRCFLDSTWEFGMLGGNWRDLNSLVSRKNAEKTGWPLQPTGRRVNRMGQMANRPLEVLRRSWRARRPLMKSTASSRRARA